MVSPPSELQRLRQHPRHADEAPNLPVFQWREDWA
jgi:hypothetical protein